MLIAWLGSLPPASLQRASKRLWKPYAHLATGDSWPSRHALQGGGVMSDEEAPKMSLLAPLPPPPVDHNDTKRTNDAPEETREQGCVAQVCQPVPVHEPVQHTHTHIRTSKLGIPLHKSQAFAVSRPAGCARRNPAVRCDHTSLRTAAPLSLSRAWARRLTLGAVQEGQG